MMEENKRLLIIWHSRTGASEALARAAFQGAGDAALLVRAEDVNAQMLCDAAGYMFICPENLATMSGMMKEMFDRTYYPALGQIEGRPYATIIAAGSDGSGAQSQLDRIVKGWRLRRVAEPMIVMTHAQTEEAILAPKTIADATLQDASDMGKAMAEGLALGVL